jgi:hypothetical protein
VQGAEQLSAIIGSITGQREKSRAAPMTCVAPSKAKSGVNSVWSHAARQLRSEGDVRAHAGHHAVAAVVGEVVVGEAVGEMVGQVPGWAMVASVHAAAQSAAVDTTGSSPCVRHPL